MIRVNNLKMHKVISHRNNDLAWQETIEVPIAEGKLILIGYKGGILIPGEYGIGKEIKPILVSHTEKIEVDDQAACYDCTTNDFVGIGQVEEVYQDNIAWCYTPGKLNYQFKCKKIIALPEHFSPKHLQDIVDGELKDGDNVLVECEQNVLLNNSKDHGKECRITMCYSQDHNIRDKCLHWCGTVTKLNSSNHITLHKVEKKIYTESECQNHVVDFTEYMMNRNHSYNSVEQLRNTVKKWFEQNVK